ncbi:MAG TPA: hypothetical protein VFS88_07740 [Micavibrio sp.]|nr:hypothetical protein [Micavibrio sp.]
MAMYLQAQHTKQENRVSEMLRKFVAPHGEPQPAVATARPKKFSGPTFREATEKFLKEYAIITKGERSEKYSNGHKLKANADLLPFFGDIRNRSTRKAWRWLSGKCPHIPSTEGKCKCAASCKRFGHFHLCLSSIPVLPKYYSFDLSAFFQISSL